MPSRARNRVRWATDIHENRLLDVDRYPVKVGDLLEGVYTGREYKVLSRKEAEPICIRRETSRNYRCIATKGSQMCLTRNCRLPYNIQLIREKHRKTKK